MLANTAAEGCYSYGQQVVSFVDANANGQLDAGERSVTASHPAGAATQTFLMSNPTPTVVTNTSDQLASGATVLYDTLTVTGGPADRTLTGTTTLYGPFATQAEMLASNADIAPVVGTANFSVALDANGSGVARTADGVEITEPGYYTWVERLDGTGQTGQWAAATETSLNYAPQVATHISNQLSMAGQTITDTVTLTNLQTEVGGKAITHTLAGRLFGPVAAGTDSNGQPTCAAVDWTTAPVAATFATETVNVAAAQGGSLTLPPRWAYQIPADSVQECFSYEATLTASVAGDESPVSVTHRVGDALETTLVTDEWAPTSVTQTSDQLVNGPTQLFDNITITGGRPDSPFTGRVSLFGPYVSQAELAAATPWWGDRHHGVRRTGLRRQPGRHLRAGRLTRHREVYHHDQCDDADQHTEGRQQPAPLALCGQDDLVARVVDDRQRLALDIAQRGQRQQSQPAVDIALTHRGAQQFVHLALDLGGHLQAGADPLLMARPVDDLPGSGGRGRLDVVGFADGVSPDLGQPEDRQPGAAGALGVDHPAGAAADVAERRPGATTGETRLVAFGGVSGGRAVVSALTAATGAHLHAVAAGAAVVGEGAGHLVLQVQFVTSAPNRGQRDLVERCRLQRQARAGLLAG